MKVILETGELRTYDKVRFASKVRAGVMWANTYSEMLEGRSEQFVEELVAQGRTPAAARKEVAAESSGLLGLCSVVSPIMVGGNASIVLARENGAENVKRVVVMPDKPLAESPYHVMEFQEIKTTWHPVGV